MLTFNPQRQPWEQAIERLMKVEATTQFTQRLHQCHTERC
jgi:hypothetical protein